MNGPEHYRRAEKLAASGDETGSVVTVQLAIAHGLLALVDAVATLFPPSVVDGPDPDGFIWTPDDDSTGGWPLHGRPAVWVTMLEDHRDDADTCVGLRLASFDDHDVIAWGPLGLAVPEVIEHSDLRPAAGRPRWADVPT